MIMTAISINTMTKLGDEVGTIKSTISFTTSLKTFSFMGGQELKEYKFRFAQGLRTSHMWYRGL